MMEAKKSKLPYLPDDVITEILVRSPAKSVGRFRCLSKLFCSLLSDPKFARKQLESTLRRSNVVRSDNRRLIMPSENLLLLLDLDSIDVEREFSFKEDLILLSKPKFRKRKSFLLYPEIFNESFFDIIGSSNGLVCFRCVHFRDKEIEVEVLLYNPTTRDSKRIPELPESVKCKFHQRMFWDYSFGFGFDALTKDYKVVKLVSCKVDEHINTVCYVYSLKTDSWRRTKSMLPYCLTYVYISSANLKGAIHWIAKTEGVDDQKVLMAFDLEKEELREMPLMPNGAEELDHYVSLDTLKGCLCVVHDGSRMPNVIIWVMKEYGLESSWSKIKIKLSDCSTKPLCLAKDDEEVLLVLAGHFVYMKLKTTYEGYTKMKASSYVESLISPNSYVEVNRDE